MRKRKRRSGRSEVLVYHFEPAAKDFPYQVDYCFVRLDPADYGGRQSNSRGGIARLRCHRVPHGVLTEPRVGPAIDADGVGTAVWRVFASVLPIHVSL